MIALMWMVACSGTGEHASTPPTPEVAAEIANAIAADPSKAEAVLAEHHVDRATFEAALLDIAADPAKTDAYLAARR